MQLFRAKLGDALGFLLTTDGLRGYAYYPISNAPANGIQHLYSVIAQSDVQDGSRHLRACLGEISSPRYYDDLSCAVIAFGDRVPDFSFDSSWPCLCGRKNPYDSLECECGRDYDAIFSFGDSAKIVDRLLFLTSLNSAFCRYSKSPNSTWPTDFLNFIQGVDIANADRFAQNLRHLYGIDDDNKQLPGRMLSEERVRRRVLDLLGCERSQELDALIADIRELRIDVFRVPNSKLRRYIKVRLGIETKYLLEDPELRSMQDGRFR